jgi:hypothetical protein
MVMADAAQTRMRSDCQLVDPAILHHDDKIRRLILDQPNIGQRIALTACVLDRA